MIPALSLVPWPAAVQRFAAPIWSNSAAVLAAIPLFAGAVLFAALADRKAVMADPPRTPIGTAEVALLAVALLVFWLLHTFDLASWRYFYIGDEYEFYNSARDWAYARGRTMWWGPTLPWSAVFNQRGSYNLIPVADAWWHGMLMRTLFGIDVVGWKKMEVAQTGAALLGFYGLARGLYGRRAAWLTLGLLIPSHYLLAYDHLGTPNLETLLPTAVALLCAIQIPRFPRTAWLWAIGAGVSAGLGWYTYYASRLALVLVFLYLLQRMPWKQWWRMGMWTLIGFLPVALPLVITTGPRTAVMDIIGESVAAQHTFADVFLFIERNIARTLLAFNTSDFTAHYVTGGLVDPLTAIAYVVGVGVALGGWCRDWRCRFLLLWLLITLAATGMASSHDYVADTRLFYALPAVVGLAVLAVETFARRRVTLFVFVAVVTVLNLHRFFVETPRKFRQTPAAVTFRVINTLRCRLAPERPLVVSRFRYNIEDALNARPYSEHPVFAEYDNNPTPDPTPWLADAAKRCVILWPEPPQTWVQALDGLHSHDVATEADEAQLTRLLVYYPKRTDLRTNPAFSGESRPSELTESAQQRLAPVPPGSE